MRNLKSNLLCILILLHIFCLILASSFFLYQRSEYPRDCYEVLSQCSSSSSDGVYLIKPDGYPEPFEVYCNNSLDDGGWTVRVTMFHVQYHIISKSFFLNSSRIVWRKKLFRNYNRVQRFMFYLTQVIQRRHDGSINFNRTWEAYEDGFGFLSQEFWLGNEKISHITNQKKYKVRIDMTTSSGLTFYVAFDEFRISDGFSNYKLVTTGEYIGVAGMVETDEMITNVCQPS